MKRLAIAVLVCLGLLSTGCGSSASDAGTPVTTAAEVGTPTPTPSASATPTAAATPTTTAGATPSGAVTDLSGAELPQFVTPGGHITCLFSDSDGVQVRCDVMGARWQVERPADCPLAYGDSITLSTRPVLTCHGDTVFSPDVTRKLGYGSAVAFHGLTCTSARAGVTCRNEDGMGFTLAQAGYRFL